MLYILFLLYVQVEVYQNILKLTNFFYLVQSFFLKKKRGLALVSLLHFLHDFSRKILHILFFQLAKFYYLVAFTSKEILGNICTVIICCPVCDTINFETNHSSLIMPVSYITKNSGQKCIYLRKKKSF